MNLAAAAASSSSSSSSHGILKRLFGLEARKGRRSGRSGLGVRMDLNPFRLCAGLKVLGYFMVVLVSGLIAVSYCAVVVLTLGPHLLHHHGGAFSSFLSFLLLALFHVLLLLLSWSYLMAVFRDPGSVPPNWKSLRQHNTQEGESISSVHNFSEELDTIPASQFCHRCQNGKPPRCHHCSICERCVLKMDHHCIWVVNCVGARNYKFFLLFLLYTFLETMLGTLVLLPGFISFFRQANHNSSSPGKLAITFLAFDSIP